MAESFVLHLIMFSTFMSYTSFATLEPLLHKFSLYVLIFPLEPTYIDFLQVICIILEQSVRTSTI